MRLFTLLLLTAALAPAQDDLTRKVTALDTELFTAYNKCEPDRFGALVAEDLEFYHDETGLSVGRQSTIDALKNNICGKVYRDLVPGTLAIYPLKNFGAIQSGIHRFCTPEAAKATGHCPDGSGVGRFTHIWRNQSGKWLLSRILSYDHCNNCSTSIAPDFRTKR